VYRPLAIAGAAALTILLLVLVNFHQRRLLQNENGQPEQQAAESFSRRALSVQVASAIATILAGSNALNVRVLSALEKLPETLLPGEPRGATDAAVYKRAAPATVLIVTNTGKGSGVVISSAGDILTNHHVIHGAKGVAVIFKPEGGVQAKKDRAYAASPIKVDEVADLALLRVNAPKGLLHPLAVAGISNLHVGDHVHEIGNPEREVWTYATEAVSGIRPKYEWKDEDGIHRATVVQTHSAVNPANSGGPLLDNAAKVIGIDSFPIEGNGLNYAIASDTIEEFLKRPTDRSTQQTVKQDWRFSRLQPFGNHIVGAYMKSQNPPPDVWLVFDKNGQPSYAVTGTSSKTRLNTVFKLNSTKKWVYYIDVDCGGVIDLIGYSSPGSSSIDRYQRPQEIIRLESMAPELVDAFANRLLPYRQVQFCSSKSTVSRSHSACAPSCNGRTSRACS
jgi:S1-C subfamily serine protease